MASPNVERDDLSRLTELVKGAVDTAVGLGVLGLQKMQVGRVELQKRLAKNEAVGATYANLRAEALRRAGHLDGVFTEARRSLEASLHPVTEKLPEPARHVTTVAQARVDELHAKFSHYIGSVGQTNDSPGTDGPSDV